MHVLLDGLEEVGFLLFEVVAGASFVHFQHFLGDLRLKVFFYSLCELLQPFLHLIRRLLLLLLPDEPSDPLARPLHLCSDPAGSLLPHRAHRPRHLRGQLAQPRLQQLRLLRLRRVERLHVPLQKRLRQLLFIEFQVVSLPVADISDELLSINVK